MRPTDRAADMRRANDMAGSPRRARRRTLFAPTVGSRRPPVVPEVPGPETPAPEAVAPDGLDEMTDLALEEFVIDDDDYPEVIVTQRPVAAAVSRPDRVDDIDQRLEEFAVSDWLDPLPH